MLYARDTNMNALSDISLLNDFAKGSEEAFTVLMNRHSSSVKSYALRILHNEEQAEEICTETFFRIAVQKGEWEDRGYSFRSYLFRIVYNLSIDVVRKRNVHRKKEGEVIQFSQIQRIQRTPEEDLEQKERAYMLQRAMAELPKIEQELILLRTTNGFSSKETASILNLKVSQVDAKYAYARKKLKQNIASLYKNQRKRS